MYTKAVISLNLIDFHCDTIYKLKKNENQSLSTNTLSVDLCKMKKACSMAQFFALFVSLDETSEPLSECLNMLDLFNKELALNSAKIKLAKTYAELIENCKNGYMSSFLTIEEGSVIEGNLNNLKELFNLGVRLMTLTWNFPNEIGFPGCNNIYMDKGLTPFGHDVVEKMNELPMIIDVSHLSDKGFYEVADISKKPFIASHSNSRAITDHSRNLTDKMIKTLANNGGVMGINFEKSFLGSSPYGRVSEMIEHINHIRNVGGIDVLSIGSDFDGIETNSEIYDISQMEKLKDALIKNKFSENEIEKIFYKNALRFIKDTLN